MNVKNRWLLGICIFIAGYVILQYYPYQNDKSNTIFNQAGKNTPLVIAHGGAKKLYPENTIYAFEKCAKMGVDALEMDIRLSADNILCTIHDEDISHYTNQKGKVWDYTYEQLSLFNFAYYFQNEKHEYVYRNSTEVNEMIPARIDDLFSKYGNHLFFVLEIKDSGKRGKQAAKILYDLIVAYEMQSQVCVASFDYDVMNYFKEINKENIACVMDQSLSKKFVIANYFGYNRFLNYAMDGLMLPLVDRDIPLDDQYLIDKIHLQHLFVFYWTIDDEKQMQALIQKGVDGIITDRPDRLLKILGK